MREKRVLLERLLSKKRIDLTPNNYFKHLRVILFFLALSALSLVALIIINFEVTYYTLLSCFGILLFTFSLIYYIRKKVKSTSVKGDILILNSINRKSCVTSILSIKKVKTKSFLGIQWTNVAYKLDGNSQKALFFTMASKVPVSPETSLQKAIRISKKTKGKP